MDIICNPSQYKELAYDFEEREQLHLHGLLPAAVRTAQIQSEVVLHNIRSCVNNISRYMLLRDLQDTNERLFYRVLCENTEELLPFVYTPAVGEACLAYSVIFRKPRGIFITLNDLGNIYNILGNWPFNDIKAIVVTDGERILGLGDLGANGMGIPIGKLSLYTASAGIQPSILLPVTLDVGTNNKSLLEDRFYIGLKQERVRGKNYEEFIDEFMQAVVKRYGQTCLIQYEDFGNDNAFRLLERYKDDYCTFNDDIQGTASVAVAGILSSVKCINSNLTEHTFLFHGAGQAAIGIANLLLLALSEEGISKENALAKIWLVDSKGLITSRRNSHENMACKKKFIKDYPPTFDMEEMVQKIKPTVLIGASAQAGVFTEGVLKKMLENCKQPIIFALSNPTEKAECTAEHAYAYTNGQCIFASGTAFPPVTFQNRVFCPSQANNAYIFPGISLAIIACKIKHVCDEVFLVAAKALAKQVTPEHMLQGRTFPPIQNSRPVSLNIAVEVVAFLFQRGFSTLEHKPENIWTFLTENLYSYQYEVKSE